MRIAMLGTRGVPASYSGFETCVEELGSRLVDRGHEVTVYCRTHHVKDAPDRYRGMRLIKLPTIASKYLDTIAHTVLSSLDLLRNPADVSVYFIAGNSPATVIPRLLGQKVVINVDGLDWKREKWPPLAKAYIRFAERVATVIPDAIITDSRVVQAYYRDRYRTETTYIPYGSDVSLEPPGPTLARFHLEPRRYLLFVGRLVPENRVDHVVEAARVLPEGMKCVVVGDAAYADAYKARLRAAAGPNVVFTGYLFGQPYRELSSSAWAFVEPSEVGGTHPALVEAMAFGSCVIANGTPENRETVDGAGLAYEGTGGAAALAAVLRDLLASPGLVEEMRVKGRARAAAVYSWDGVTSDYEALFRRLLADAHG